jgi:hypothetical protein
VCLANIATHRQRLLKFTKYLPFIIGPLQEHFLKPFPFHHSWSIRYLAVGLFFPLFSLCGAAGLRGTFSGHPRPPLLSFLLSGRHSTNTTHNIHGWPIRPGFEPCRPRGGVGRVSLFLPPPYRQPLKDIHTHPWPGGGSFLGKKPPPSVRFEPTSAGTATSEHCLRQPCGHRATLHKNIIIITIIEVVLACYA